MDISDIKFKTMQMLNGFKYMVNKQANDFKYYVCYMTGIETTEENFKIIEDTITLYFNTTSSIN